MKVFGKLSVKKQKKLVNAYLDGREIEYSLNGLVWMDKSPKRFTEISFDWDVYYRIKEVKCATIDWSEVRLGRRFCIKRGQS